MIPFLEPQLSRPLGPRRAPVAVFACTLALVGATAAVPGPGSAIWPTDGNSDVWARRTYDARGTAQDSPLPVRKADDGSVHVDLPVSLPGVNEFVHPIRNPWFKWGKLAVEIELPARLPADAQLYVFTKDWDFLWRQVRLRVPQTVGRAVVLTVPISGAPAEAAWRPCGHSRPWHTLTPLQVREVGLKVVLPPGSRSRFQGVIRLRRMWLDAPVSLREPLAITQFSYRPRAPRVGETCEFTIGLRARYSNPFDSSQVLVEARITGPDGRVELVRGFYYEGFTFPDGQLSMPLTPSGRPCFKIRYTPRSAGKHRVRITIRAGPGRGEIPEFALPVAPSAPDYAGFVRVDRKDKRFFSYDTGRVFEGAGINVRSPFDTRYAGNAPYSTWRDQGLACYPDLFRKYQASGVNVVEVWMCSWWLALEWIPDRPGYHGVGYMNPYHAWMLDRIFQWARARGIYIILVFNNHGKFGMTFDREWGRNPFNVKNGGFLDDCEKYFSDTRAKAAFKRFCDYTVARWASNPNLLAWKLFTEIDLTGNSLGFYQKPVMSQWHKEMGDYLKSRDIYKHMITTHWMLSYKQINAAVADLPELDFLTTDAYYQKGATAELLELLRGSIQFQAERKKPLLITEFGGSPYGEGMGNLIKQHHLGLWTGFFWGFPIPPMFWWFALIDEKDLYPEYAAFRRFTAGEDRRGMTGSDGPLGDTGIRVNWLKESGGRVLVWGYDERYYLAGEENLSPREVADLKLPLTGLAPGVYDVEFWDCGAGRPIRRATVVRKKGKAGAGALTVPPFRLDFALKLIPKNGK
ncbi:MAG: DUF5060 domain-containing protein [Kiritimatiellaeota bacterium]|nr:DUF5060 domain-containing protein [Kiritimatiellota bacterium]